MARSVSDIQKVIIAAKEADTNLSTLDSTSKVAIWRLWAYVVAYAIYTLELLFDTHKSELNTLIANQKKGSAVWYRNMALAFQYGFDLLAESDQFKNTGQSDTDIQNSKIVKYAAVTESETDSRLIIKIATEKGEELSPISNQQQEAFTAYMQQVKYAGVRVTVINYLPDILRLSMQIYRDPLVIDENGVSILTGKKPVEEAIKKHLKELPFNGELVLASLVDTLQQVDGVKIPHILSASSKWIDVAVNDYGDYSEINVKKIPVSGYFAIENFNNISYVV